MTVPCVRVLIIAAYASMRTGLRTLLEENDDIIVAGQGAGSSDLEELLPTLRPDVILLEETPGERNWLSSASLLAETSIVVLGEDRNGFQALARLSTPGWAYLLKEAEGPEIAAAVRAAAAGLIALDRSLGPLFTPDPRQPRVAAHSSEIPGEALSPREREVLQLMAQGLPNKQIATRMGLSAHTVKFHVASILAKFSAASRTEAVTIGARRGDVLL